MHGYFRSRLYKYKSAFAFIFSFIGIIYSDEAQSTSFHFRHLTNNEGLSDGVVHSFAQDKYGFMWIGTSNGLNRFDGINIKAFFSKQNDSTTLTNNYVQSLYCDSKNNLWIGTFSGLCRYDYPSNRFIRYSTPKPNIVNDIRED